ncbi:MAG: excinuclease ABC subunit UvrC [Saprospiraceae bacterium]|nr:excinuclease ABC subunit UvrC [Saprospiraceae bacterium]
MNKEDYKKIADTLPLTPGVYRFIDAEGEILYIGKAKRLKQRISSYFSNRKDMRHKTRIMVRNSEYIEYTLVETEQDALLLEASLIKKHLPRYNIALKSDKPYPYICIKKERFPRVFITRNVIKDGSRYFGPYVSRKRIYALLELIKDLFKLRTCQLKLTEENIIAQKFKVCLEYHIKNCKAPCVGFETEEEYNEKIEQIANILKGNFSGVKRYLQGEMMRFAEELEFERAQEIKQQLKAFENYQGKSTVVNPLIRDVDVFSIKVDEGIANINYMKVANGAIINTYTLELEQNLNEDSKDVLFFGVETLREKFQSLAEEIIVPFEIPCIWDGVKITVPKIGDKKKLLDLSQKNISYFVLQKKKKETTKHNKQTAMERILEQMKKDLHMDALPLHIECFDNSNLQGTNPVSSCVVFKNLKPAKRDYRHFHVKTVVGPDDYASMEEVVYRRYKRLLDKHQPLPQLIIIDGGKGQLNSAIKSLKALNIYKRVHIIGIAKRLEEIYFAEDPIPLLLSKRSYTLQVIQQARNEAHRFAIEFHRNIRSKKLLGTELTDIKGVGKKTAEKLLEHFGSVKKVKAASLEALTKIAGKSVATKIQEHYKNIDNQNTDSL